MLEEGTPGRLIRGRYRLVAEIGSGGMGRVWEGRDEQLNRPVAVKEVQIHVASAKEREDRLARAEREGRNAAALADHPNVVTVYDVVVEDGVPWTVMQLVRGVSLKTALEAGPVEPGRVAAIAAAMLSALGAVHGAGIIHRDVKPGNIMLADDGQILLTDFGIAKGGGDETVTSTGGFLGSLEYTAPERAEGAAGDLSSDLFSLGVTLYHAVEGEAPFHRETRTGILTAILLKPLPPMTRATGSLQTLIRALTMKNPADRPTVAQAHELLSGTRTLWEPLARAETIESSALAGTQKLATAPKPQLPWEEKAATSTNNIPRPQLLMQAQTLDASGERGGGRKRTLILAASGAAVVLAAATGIVLGLGGSGGSGAKNGAVGPAGLAVGTSGTSRGDNAGQGQGAKTGLDGSSDPSASADLSPSLQSLLTTLATLPEGADNPGGQTAAPGQQATNQPPATTRTTTKPPAPTTTHTTTTKPPAPKTYSEQAGASGAATFTNYHNASGAGARLAAAQWVQVTCKVYDGTIPSVKPDGYWYRIASSPYNNAYYAPANSFKNGDPWTGTITNPHNTDFNVPNC